LSKKSTFKNISCPDSAFLDTVIQAKIQNEKPKFPLEFSAALENLICGPKNPERDQK
jgi:hypothetical protein